MASPDEWFSQSLEKFLNGTLERYKVFDLGLTPNLGINRFPKAQAIMPQSILRKIVQDKHMIPVELLKTLPSLIQKPVRVFRSKSEHDTAVFQLSILHDGKPLVMVAKYGRHKDFGVAYLITTIHPRPFDQLENWVQLGLLLYPRPIN